MFQPVRQVSVNFADNEKQSNKTFNILYFMKTNLVNLALGLAFTGGAVSCQSQKNDLVFEHQGDTVTIVHIARPAKYLLLPIQESSKEGLVRLDTGSPADTDMDVRLATDSVEYYVPFALPQGSEEATVIIKKVAADGLSGNFWLVSFKISYLCLPLFYETRTTPSCHPSGCAYRQL